MKIGLIGLGIMGKPMAKNLMKGGYTDLLVSDLDRDSVAEIKAATNREIGESCDLVLTMLPNSPQVEAVMLGEEGVGAYMKPGSTFIDMSSINPVNAKKIAAELAKRGVEMLDSPVSGGEPKAIDGTLSFMVGGKQEVFDKFKPVLATMGASVVRCGDVGAGNTTKLANQIIVACNIQALAEALTPGPEGRRRSPAGVRGYPGGTGRLHRHERQGPHDDRRQRQARLYGGPAHQGPEQRPGLRPHRGGAAAHDRRGDGGPPVAPQP